MYGSHMAQRRVLDRTILASVQRVGGISSMHGLQLDMGRYETVDFADILNDPTEDPNLPKETPHDMCEKVYGL